MLQSLSAYIPFTDVQMPVAPQGNAKICSSCNSRSLFSRFSFCQYCGKAFCPRCILKQRIYRFNLPSLQFICVLCSNSLCKQDAELWKEKCLSLIVANDLQSVLAAHGCMTMALCGDIDANGLLYKMAKKLSEQNFYAFLLEYFTNYLFNCTDTESVKACVAIGSTLKNFADHPNLKYLDKLSLLMAAKNAYACAQKTGCSVEIPSLDRHVKDVTRKLHHAYNEEKRVYAEKATSKLENAWRIRNFYDMISLLLQPDEEFGSFFDDYAMMGLKNFLPMKIKYIDNMLSEDRAAILLFQGIFKLYENEHDTGLLDIEKAVWKGCHLEWMPKAAIDVLLLVLTKASKVTPHENLPSNLSNLSPNELFSTQKKFLTNLCLNPARLNAPFARNWPNLSVPGVNTRATFKYEQAALKHFNEGKWKAQDVALAYIDFIPSCEHPAETCACFLLAGLWFLKEMESFVSVKKLQNLKFNPKLYAIKQAALLCTSLAFSASQEFFHPGIQLYVARVGLQIVLRAKESAQSCFTKEDGCSLSQLLNVVIRTSQFFPFWDIPIVMACEAPLLHILTGDLHSEFILSLQHIPTEKYMPFKDYELQYQLYENDLRRLCPLDNPEEAQLQAMNSMLMEKGWSMEDVSYLLTSPLSPRTPEGWLIQGPKLGVPMEYASIEGFVLDLENPLLQLVVVKADNTNVGLISQNDLRECLHLPRGPMFFSLDPPDDDHRYHPFQAFRYEPKELQGSTILHTMFETDYLLKSFSVGTEVSSVPPFKQRPCKEGLVAKLPQYLQNVLRPMSERGQSQSHIQRFWIKADELLYDEYIENGKLIVKLKKPKMAIRTHPLMIDTDGKLKDTSEDANPNSPECKFAMDLTSYYDEIGKYFPIFARLQEIIKMWFLGIIIKCELEQFKNRAEDKHFEVPSQVLKEIQEMERRDQLQRVDECLTQVKEHYQSIVKSLSDAKLKIVSHLLKLCRDHGCRNTMESKVDNWLNNKYYYLSFRSAEEDLIDYICGCIKSVTYQATNDSENKQTVSSMMASYKTQYETIKSNRSSHLSQAKQQHVQELTKVFKGDQNTIERLVSLWLDSSSGSSKLSSYLYQCLPKTSRYDVEKLLQEKWQRKYSLLSNYISNLKGPNMQQTLPMNFCNWVPAALHHTENKSKFCLCYGGVLICPKTIRSPLSVSHKSVYVTVTVNPHSFRGYPQSSKCIRTDATKQRNNRYISAKNSSDGSVHFHFNVVLNSSSRSNLSSIELQLKDRLTNVLQWDSHQRNSGGSIQHSSRPQNNVRTQNNTGAHMNAQRAFLNSRNRFYQMKMYSERNQGNLGGKKSHSSSTAAAGGHGGDGGGSDDDGGNGGKYKSPKHTPWKKETWE